MNAKNKPSSPKRRTVEEELANVEQLSPAEIDAELERYNINPEPAIKKVKAMVQQKLNDWRKRGVLHSQNEVAHAGGGDD